MDLTAVIKQFRLLFYDIKLLLEFTCVWWWYIPLEQYHWSVGRTSEIYFISKLKRIQRCGVMKACFATKETVTIFLKTQEPFIRKDYFLTTSFMSLAAF